MTSAKMWYYLMLVCTVVDAALAASHASSGRWKLFGFTLFFAVWCGAVAFWNYRVMKKEEKSEAGLS